MVWVKREIMYNVPSGPGNPINPLSPASPFSPTEPSNPFGPNEPLGPGKPSLPIKEKIKNKNIQQKRLECIHKKSQHFSRYIKYFKKEAYIPPWI